MGYLRGGRTSSGDGLMTKKAKTYRSEGSAAIHQMMEDMSDAGVVYDQTLRRFDQTCLVDDKVPWAITDQEEYDRIEAICIGLVKKGEEKLSPEEYRLLDQLASFLEDYEKRALPELHEEDTYQGGETH